jgi:hypothetical protein
MRDHLLGHTPSAQHSAKFEADAQAQIERGWWFSHDVIDPYPLGVPNRVIEADAALYATTPKERAASDFENKAHAYPDGSYRTASMDCTRAKFLINIRDSQRRAEDEKAKCATWAPF